jgi:RNA polymerase sigma-70 factor (ECF subfamily)
MVDDFDLIREFQNGNERTFDTLVRRYQRQVANIIYLTMGTREGLEDLAQEVFVRVHRSLGRFKFDAAFFSWLYRITVNVCIDELRKRRVRRALSLDFLAESGDIRLQELQENVGPAELMVREERRHLVLQALQRLPAAHRQILVLREYEGLSYQEISDTLAISVQAVKSRLFRARDDMHRLLSPLLGDES